MHADLRMHPRMTTEIPAEMILSDEVAVDVLIRNISLGGMMVEGSDQMFQAVQQQVPAFPVEVEIHFGLQGAPVHCHCRLIHTTRKRQDLYHMGFKALSMDEHSAEQIRQVLAEYEMNRGSA